MKTYHKGGLYTFGVLDAGNSVFIFAFGVAGDNKNEDNWKWFISHFKDSITCLEDKKLDTLLNLQVLQEHGGSDDDDKSNDEHLEEHKEDKEVGEEIDIYSKSALFISDRNKGIANALRTYFPNNHLCNCLWHIKQNVMTRYGKTAPLDVTKIAKTFSSKQENFYLEKF